MIHYELIQIVGPTFRPNQFPLNGKTEEELIVMLNDILTKIIKVDEKIIFSKIDR
jgi:hypothetical protein